LCGRINARFSEAIVRQVSQKVECAPQPSFFFAQNNFIAASENFYLRGPKAELLRQPHGLTIAGFEDTRRSHLRIPVMYLQ
jgi:hypothetical protein